MTYNFEHNELHNNYEKKNIWNQKIKSPSYFLENI